MKSFKRIESLKRFKHLKKLYQGKFVKHDSEYFGPCYYFITKMTFFALENAINVEGYDVDFNSINSWKIHRPLDKDVWENRVEVIS